MTTYRAVNAMWPDPFPVPTSREAITGAKRLIRRAHRLAIEDGAIPKYAKLRPRKFKITSGRRYTEIRSGVWYVNPNQGNHWGWHQIVHGISHWAQRHYWPQADGHGPLHAWLESELADYAIKNFLDGKLARPEKVKAPADKIAVRAAAVAKRIKKWEAKRRRADTALRKLHRQEKHYARRTWTSRSFCGDRCRRSLRRLTRRDGVSGPRKSRIPRTDTRASGCGKRPAPGTRKCSAGSGSGEPNVNYSRGSVLQPIPGFAMSGMSRASGSKAVLGSCMAQAPQ